MSPESPQPQLVGDRTATGEGRSTRRRIVIPWSDVLITIASIVLAFIVGALLMIFSDTKCAASSRTSSPGLRMR